MGNFLVFLLKIGFPVFAILLLFRVGYKEIQSKFTLTGIVTILGGIFLIFVILNAKKIFPSNYHDID